jgi:hypothetical protein
LTPRERSMRQPALTTRCPKCAAEYAVACPACPYCAWVPLKPGRARWQRTALVLTGLAISALVAIGTDYVVPGSDPDLRAGLVFAGGAFLTTVLANRYIGGGKDV